MPGLDGQKMSKSYNNTVSLREDPDAVAKKIRTMPTDPARVKRTDPGEPDKCPVWQLHQVYSDEQKKQWVQQGCRSAGIGCLECKQPVIDSVLAELAPMRERAQKFLDDPTLVKNIVTDGCPHEQGRFVDAEFVEEMQQVELLIAPALQTEGKRHQVEQHVDGVGSARAGNLGHRLADELLADQLGVADDGTAHGHALPLASRELLRLEERV